MTHSGDPTTTAAIINGGGGGGDIKGVLEGQHHHHQLQLAANGGHKVRAGPGRSPAKAAGLSRSDSYRRARPLLSPAEARKVFRNSADVSSLDFSQCSLSATMTTEEDDEDERREERKETKGGGGGFFRNLRSQFSFSSLRRKSPKKQQPVVVLDRASVSNASDMSVPGFTPEHHGGSQPRMTSTPVSGGCVGRPMSEPRMTSTPLSSCADSLAVAVEPRRTSSPNSLNCVSAEGPPPRQSAELRRPPSAGSGEMPGVKFRTAALKNQYQRWSFAEQTLREGNHNLLLKLPLPLPLYTICTVL